MDLAKIARDAARIAMSVAGTAKTSATLHTGATNAMNWTTDSTSPSGGATTTVLGLKYDLKQAQGEGETSWITEFLIEGVDAPDGIDEADTVEIEGDTWQIVIVKHVPTEAIIILGIRK